METPIEYRPMYPAEAFAILHGLFENAAKNDEADLGDFTSNLRICDLYWIGDDVSFGVSGKAGVLESLFGFHVSKREWRKALKPGKKKTVVDLCVFLAEHALVAVIPMPLLLGRPCRAAGAFFAVRQMLSEAHVDTEHLTPSTRLEDFSKDGFPKIWSDLIRTAPSLLSRTRWKRHWDLHFILLAIPLLFSTIAGGLVSQGSPLIGIPWAFGSFLAFVLVWRLSEKRATLAEHVSFEGLTTFRDLCKYLCDANSNRLCDEQFIAK